MYVRKEEGSFYQTICETYRRSRLKTNIKTQTNKTKLYTIRSATTEGVSKLSRLLYIDSISVLGGSTVW